MATTTLRPNATVTTSGTSPVTGAATRHAATADNSDATYFRLEGFAAVQLGFTDLPSLPAGTVTKTVAVRARVDWQLAGTLSPSPTTLLTTSSIPGVTGSTYVNWTGPTTVTAATLTGTVDPATVNAGWVELKTQYAGYTRVYEAYLDVVTVALPVVDVTAPTGTIDTANRPYAQWAATLDADGGAQTQYRVLVYSQAQYTGGGFAPGTTTALFDTGTQTGTASTWQFTGSVVNGTYRSYVRVAQTVNSQLLWSAWDYSEYTIDVDAPAAPDITAVADDANARMEITVTANTGDATTDLFELERQDGTDWQPVRGAHPVDNPAPLILDNEAPNGGDVTYRARALHDYAGSLVASGWATVTVTSWVATAWWIKHPTRTELNMLVRVRSFPTVTRAGRIGVFQPLGARAAVAVTDTRGPVSGTITLRMDSLAEQAQLDALLDTGDPLLVQSPPGEGAPPGYIAVSNHTRTRIADWASATRTFDALDFTTVSSPVSAAG